MITGYRTERRKFQRMRVTLSVLYNIECPVYVRRVLGDREFEAETIDLSEGGVALTVGHYLPSDTRIFMRFILHESEHTGLVNFYDPLNVSGEIRSCDYIGGCQYRLGIRFQGVDQEQRNTLLDLKFSSIKPLIIS